MPTKPPARTSYSPVDPLEACIERDYPRLLGLLRALGATQADAEDALQEACARAVERSSRQQAVLEHPDAWLATVAINHLRSVRRRQRRLVELPPEIGAIPDRDDRLIDLELALRRLPRRQQQAVFCHYYFGLRTRETARVLGVSEGTVKTALSRARLRLGVLLEPALKEVR